MEKLGREMKDQVLQMLDFQFQFLAVPVTLCSSTTMAQVNQAIQGANLVISLCNLFCGYKSYWF